MEVMSGVCSEEASGLCCVQVAQSYSRAACREAAIVVAMTLGSWGEASLVYLLGSFQRVAN